MRPSFGHREHRERRSPGPPFGGWPDGGSFDFPGDSGPWRGRGRGHRRGPHGRRRRRGDIRTAILALLTERPMHGYEMIQEISERSGGYWRPSPGSVYPTLQLLADEGLVDTTEGSGGRRHYDLTDEGRETAAKHEGSPPWEQIAQDVDPADVSLRDAIGPLMGAAAQVANAATDRQKQRAIEILNEARRELYAILGESDSVED